MDSSDAATGEGRGSVARAVARVDAALGGFGAGLFRLEDVALVGWLVLGVPTAEVVVHPIERQGILDVRGPESRGQGLRRYVRDRYRAPARTLMALARRG